jgi:hypothetical protein
VAKRSVGAESHAGRPANRLAVGRGNYDPVAAPVAEHLRRGVEHLGRPDEVEELHAVEADEHDLTRILNGSGDVRKAAYPSDPANRRLLATVRW